MKRKSMYKIVSDTIVTCKRSFWGIVYTYLLTAVILFAIYWFVNRYLGINLRDLKPFVNLPKNTSYAYAFLLFYIPVVLKIWQVLVIKNNLFYGESKFNEAFDCAVKKSVLVIFFIFPALIFFALLAYLFVKIISSYMVGFPVITFLLLPTLILFFMGLILEDDKFKNIIKKSYRAATFHYIRTLVSLIVLIVLLSLFVLFYTSVTGILLGLNILKPFLWLVGPILQGLMYITFDSFIMCYFLEVFYAFAVEDEEQFDKNEVLKEDNKTTKNGNNKVPSSGDTLQGMHMLGSEPNNGPSDIKEESVNKDTKADVPKP